MTPSSDDLMAQLYRAHDEATVLAIARQFMATILPSELEKLPPQCSRISVDSAEEIAEAAVVLTRCELKFPPETDGAALLRRMANFFVIASNRISRFRNPLKPTPSA